MAAQRAKREWGGYAAALVVALAVALLFLLAERGRLVEEVSTLRELRDRYAEQLAACEGERDRLSRSLSQLQTESERLKSENLKLLEERAGLEARLSGLQRNYMLCSATLEACEDELWSIVTSLAGNSSGFITVEVGYVHWLKLVLPEGYSLRVEFRFVSSSPVTVYLLTEEQWVEYWRDGVIRSYLARREGTEGRFTATLKAEKAVDIYYIAFREAKEDTLVWVSITTYWEKRS